MTICTPWRVANSLNQLLAQANALAPHRNKASDGSIGDPAHQAEACASQHNSCCVRVGGVWIIRARDFTHDPAGGFDSYAFAEQLRLSHDPRIRYVISNRRITSASRNWQWESYSGSDPHTNHAHVSVWDDQARFDDTSRAWRITAPGGSVSPAAGGTGKDEITVFYLVPNGQGGANVFNENGVLVNNTEFPDSLASRVPLMKVSSEARMRQLTTASVALDTQAIAKAVVAGLPAGSKIDVDTVVAALESEAGQAALVKADNTAEDQ